MLILCCFRCESWTLNLHGSQSRGTRKFILDKALAYKAGQTPGDEPNKEEICMGAGLLRQCVMGVLIAGSAGWTCTGVKAQEQPAELTKATWLVDYNQAMKQAEQEGKQLFLFFHHGKDDSARLTFEEKVLTDAQVEQSLAQNFVCAKVPVEAQIRLDGQPLQILAHPAFEPMRRTQGVAVVDLQHRDKPYYGRVTSVYPFRTGHHITKETLQVLLELPEGTLTQRTMILAVRLHPESPGSANGAFDPMLAIEAAKQSHYQANIGVQGHHQWESRFHQITAQLPPDKLAQEVVAESWPGQDLMEAAFDCVHCWRQSPGHWDAVRTSHSRFGFDIKRGRNGIWYATGLFAQDRHGPVRNLFRN